MGDVFSFFTGNKITNAQSNNASVYNSKTDFKNKTSISDFRNRGANKIKFNGQELKAKEIRDVVGNIISGGHQTAKQIMRQLKDKYRVEIDDRRKIMRAVTDKFTRGTNDIRTDSTKQMLYVNKIIKDADISSQTAGEIRDRIKREREATGKSKIAENIEDFVKKLQRNRNYNKNSQDDKNSLPSAAFALKQNRSGKQEALKGALVTGDRITNSTNIGVEQVGEDSIVSIGQHHQNKHYEKSTSALSHEKDATPVAGNVTPVDFSKGKAGPIKKSDIAFSDFKKASNS